MNDRIPHWIKPLKKVKAPARCLFFDVETRTIDAEGTQEMILACSVYCEYRKEKQTTGSVWLETESAAELFCFILDHTKTKTPLRVMSANIWFDLRVSGLLIYFANAKWKCNQVYINNKVFFARFSKGKHVIEFVNIQNYFRSSVKDIGKSIGLPKLDIDFENTNRADLKVYCKRDVEIIYTAFTDYVNYIVNNELGSIGYTVTSTAYNVYRKSFMSQWLFVHCDNDINKLERDGYYGGRCECFYLGSYTKGPYYKLDVNSMYPFVMAENKFPYHLKKVGENLKPDIINLLKGKFSYTAHVTVSTDQPIYAYRQDDKLTFPTGTFETYLNTPSLNYAFRNNHLTKIHKIAVYDHDYLFTDYVNHLYSERLRYKTQGNLAFALTCRLMLNSFYGKFGQRIPELIYEGETDINNNLRESIYDVDEKCYYVKQCFYGLEQLFKMNMIETGNSIPVISAHVTDYARLYLWQLCIEAGINNLYYVDTDSLIVNQIGYDRLMSELHQDRLGALKLEGRSDKIEILGLKNYIFDGVHKLKGIPIKHKKINDTTYEYTYFPGVISELKDGHKKPYQIKTVTKVLNDVYDKGIVKPNGQVVPYRLDTC